MRMMLYLNLRLIFKNIPQVNEESNDSAVVNDSCDSELARDDQVLHFKESVHNQS